MRLLYSILFISVSLFASNNDECHTLDNGDGYTLGSQQTAYSSRATSSYAAPTGTYFIMPDGQPWAGYICIIDNRSSTTDSYGNYTYYNWRTYSKGEPCTPEPACDATDPDADCNGDGTPNGQEPDFDFDGDGIPNSIDTDDDNDGIDDSYDNYYGPGTDNGQGTDPNGSPKESPDCPSLREAAQLKCKSPDILKFTCKYSEGTHYPYILQNECVTNVDLCFDIADYYVRTCKAPSIINGSCHYNPLTGKIDDTFSCDTPDPDMSPCEVARHNLEQTCKYPDYIAGSCIDSYGQIIGDNTYHCVHVNDNNTSSGGGGSTTDNNTSGGANTNDRNSSVNLNPLIQTNNQNTQTLVTHIDKVEKNTRLANDKLTSIDSKLGTLINSNLNTNNSIDAKLGLSNNLLNSVSSNTAATANKLDITNSHLSDIKDTLHDINDETGTFQNGVNSINTNNIDIDTTPIDESSDYLDNLTDNVAYLTDDVTSIKSQFIDLRAMLEGDHTVLRLSGGGCSDPNLSKFASIISPYSAVFALVTYVSFMLAIFKMIFMYLSRGEN